MNENDQNGTFENFVKMENFINLPPTPGRFGPDRPEVEISCLKGCNGWGVPLGNEPACPQSRAGVVKHLNICAICYIHVNIEP